MAYGLGVGASLLNAALLFAVGLTTLALRHPFPHSTVKCLRYCQKCSKMAFFFKFLVNTVTLTVGQGHSRSYNFEGLPTGYPLANFHNSAVNSVQVIANVKVYHGQTDGQTDRWTDDGV